MTLEYRSANYKPPCQRGLTVWGVLFLLAAGFVGLVMVVGVFGLMMFVGRAAVVAAAPAGGPTTVPVGAAGAGVAGAGGAVTAGGNVVVTAPTFDSGTLFMALAFVALVYGSIALGLGWLGVGMLRKKRWVRPWIITLSAWLLLTCAIAIPGTVLNVWFTESDAARSWASLVALVAMFSIGMGVALSLFRYFRKPEMVETLNHFDPSPSRFERWPTPVFGAAVFAGLGGLFGLFGLWMPLMDLASGVSAGGLAMVGSGVLAGVLCLVGGVYCLIRPRLGWQILMATLALSVVSALIMNLFFSDYQLRTMVKAGELAPQSAIPPTWVLLVQGLLAVLAYAIALWIIRKPFLSPDPEIPLAQLAPQN